MSNQQTLPSEQEMKTYRVQGLSCTNCAAKFENNVKNLEGVKDAKVNFGASKITVYGETTIEELEKAGAFENLKIQDEKEQRIEYKPFGRKKKILRFIFRLHCSLLVGF